MTSPSATQTLAVLVDGHADALHLLAEKFRAFTPSESLPSHRILALSGQLLAQLGDVEHSVHELARWLPPRGAA